MASHDSHPLMCKPMSTVRSAHAVGSHSYEQVRFWGIFKVVMKVPNQVIFQLIKRDIIWVSRCKSLKEELSPWKERLGSLGGQSCWVIMREPVRQPCDKESRTASRAEIGPNWQQKKKKKWGPQSYNCKEMNLANNYMNLKKDLSFWKEYSPPNTWLQHCGTRSTGLR